MRCRGSRDKELNIFNQRRWNSVLLPLRAFENVRAIGGDRVGASPSEKLRIGGLTR